MLGAESVPVKVNGKASTSVTQDRAGVKAHWELKSKQQTAGAADWLCKQILQKSLGTKRNTVFKISYYFN